MKKLKVLLAAPVPPPYGGIGNWVLLMQKYLATREDIALSEIVNIAPKKRSLDGRSLMDRIVGQGLEMLKLNRQLKEKIATCKPDVLHMTTSGQLAVIRDILFLKTAKKLGVPSVYHIRFGRIPDISKADTKEWKMIKKAVDLSTRTIVIDKKTYESLLKIFPKDRVELIPNPFDISKIQTVALETETKKVVTFVGWCIKEKGVEELLTAWQAVYQQHPDWELQLIGPAKDDYKEYLLAHFSMKGVRLMGEQNHDDAMRMVRNSAVFILPSYTEGFPNAVLEAMALERAVIATSVGAIPEMLSTDAGLVVPPRDADAVARALEALISDEAKRKTLGKNAKNRVMQEYLVETITDKYKSVWGEVSGYK